MSSNVAQFNRMMLKKLELRKNITANNLFNNLVEKVPSFIMQKVVSSSAFFV
jgi:hypothetical protein